MQIRPCYGIIVVTIEVQCAVTEKLREVRVKNSSRSHGGNGSACNGKRSIFQPARKEYSDKGEQQHDKKQNGLTGNRGRGIIKVLREQGRDKRAKKQGAHQRNRDGRAMPQGAVIVQVSRGNLLGRAVEIHDFGFANANAADGRTVPDVIPLGSFGMMCLDRARDGQRSAVKDAADDIAHLIERKNGQLDVLDIPRILVIELDLNASLSPLVRASLKALGGSGIAGSKAASDGNGGGVGGYTMPDLEGRDGNSHAEPPCAS